MDHYFYRGIPKEEFEILHYFPTIPEYVTWFEKQWGDRPAVNNLREKYNYREFADRIAARRAYLKELGLSKGDNVAVLDLNSIDAVELFLAITSGGYVAIMLPAQLPAPAVVGSCMKFAVKALFVRDEFRDRAEGVPCKVCSTKETSTAREGVATVDKDDPAAIFFTGGTTGTPKGAVLPHRALMRGAYNGCFNGGSMFSGDRYMGLLPLSHVFGLIRSTMAAFYTGAEWYACENMKESIGKMPMMRPTILVLVPGLCDVLIGLGKMYGPKFYGGCLKTVISGAANVPPRIISEFDKLGVTCFAGYGMTEGANLTTGNLDVATRPTSVGKIFPEQEVKIVDGEIWFRGDNVFLGYYGDPQKTAETLTPDGWLKTGDLGRFDEDGYLYIVGRIKNLIILANAENVSPEELEEPFYKYDGIKDCLVKEDKIGDQPCIAIEILPRMEYFEGKDWSEVEAYCNDLVAKVNETLPSTHRIAKVSVRKEDFKRTGSLKVSRNQ
ncbi:MAG: acyl--CoA ligase [Bacteroidales bacterium]|nr:acyl--CoA ligase [Bacteroidales bacterium]